MEMLALLGVGLLGLVVVGPFLAIAALTRSGRLQRELDDLHDDYAGLVRRLERLEGPAADRAPAAHRTTPPSEPAAAPRPQGATGPAERRPASQRLSTPAATPHPAPVTEPEATTGPAPTLEAGRPLPATTPPSEATHPLPATTPGPETVATTPEPLGARRQTAATSVAVAAETASQPTPGRDRGWEWLLGTRGLTVAGVVTLFLSFAFLLRYAIGQGWIGPELRLAAVALAGGGLFGGGWWALRRRMTALGQGLLGGGLATWYLCVLAALKPGLLVVDQPLIAPGPAFALLALVVGLGVGIAVRRDMPWISLVALVGGFAAPVLTSTGGSSQHLLFGYLLVLDAGVLAAALYRRWRALDCTAFAGTALLFAAWFARSYPAPGAPWSTLAWLLVFGAAFALLPLLPHWRARDRVRGERFALGLGSVVFVFGYAALMLAEDHRLALALLCLGGAAAQQVLGTVTLRRCGRDPRVEHGFRLVTLLLLTLGLLYLLPVNAVAAGWTLEAVLLVALGYRFGIPSVRAYAVPLWLLAAGRTLYELPTVASDAPWLAHAAGLQLLVLPLGAAAIAVVHRWRPATRRGPGDELVAAVATVGAAVVAVAIAWWDWSRIETRLVGGGTWGLAQWRVVLLALVPAALAGLAALAHRLQPWRLLRRLGMALAGFALLVCIGALIDQPPAWPLVNPHAVLAAVLALGLGVALRRAPPVALALPGLAWALILGGDLAAWCGRDTSAVIGAAWFAWGPLAFAAAAGALAWRRCDHDLALLVAMAWSGAVACLGLSYLETWGASPPWFNLRALAGILALAPAAWFLWQGRSWQAGTDLRRFHAIAAVLWGLVVVSCEWPLWILRVQDEPALARLVLSLCWLAYAAGLLVLGLGRRIRAARLAALALFALCAAKLLLVDLADSGTLVRIASFCATGLVLIAASWLYHRLERRLESDGDPIGASGEPAGNERAPVGAPGHEEG